MNSRPIEEDAYFHISIKGDLREWQPSAQQIARFEKLPLNQQATVRRAIQKILSKPHQKWMTTGLLGSEFDKLVPN